MIRFSMPSMSIGKTQWGDASLPWREVKCIIQTIQQYLQFPFVRYTLVVGTLIALCSLLLGVTLVLKRFSFVGDRLSHVAFGAMLIAGVLHITNDMLFVMPVTIACFILVEKVVAAVRRRVNMMCVGSIVTPPPSSSSQLCLRLPLHRS